MGIEDHRNDDDRISQKNGQNGLPPVHAPADERRREHVSRNARRHGDPQGSDAADAPFPLAERHGRKIVVVEMRLLDLDRDVRRVGGVQRGRHKETARELRE